MSINPNTTNSSVAHGATVPAVAATGAHDATLGGAEHHAEGHHHHHHHHGHHAEGAAAVAGGEHHPAAHETSHKGEPTNAAPGIGDKISGKVDQLVGKITHDPAKVEVGVIKATEGSDALKAGLSAGVAQGAKTTPQ